MLIFLARRILQSIPVLFGVSIVVFSMTHLIPGDTASVIAGLGASSEDIENVRRALRLDQPIYVQYGAFLADVFSGDFGTSFRTGRPVVDEILPRFVNTLALSAVALAVAILIGVATGIISAVKKNTVWDNAALVLSLVGISLPSFFLGLMLMLVFAVQLGMLPLSGNATLAHYVLPAVTLGTASAAVISRIMRSSLLEVVNQDYIRTARAKGLGETRVIGRHAVQNSLIPVVTVVGLQLGYLLGGAVVVETVFAWPGLGRLLVQSITARDFPVVQAAVLLIAVSFVTINLLTDLLYGVLDPRIRSS